MENLENAIEIRNMSKSFKVQYDGAHTIKEALLRRHKGKIERHLVLDNINLDIKKGETVALIGVNGSGKSTLLKLMTKIIYPDKGTIKTNGKLTSLLELGAGFHQDFTGRENVYFNASIFGLTEKEIDARLDEIVSFSELGSAIDEPIRTYSSGMYMRLAFSVAINVDADILLLDEILAVGDQRFQDKCFAKLEELKDSNKTIVIVSHSTAATNKICDRAVWICNHKVREDGNAIDVSESYIQYLEKENIAKKRVMIESGELQPTGVIVFDSPKSNSIFGLKENIILEGWKISDLYDSKLIVLANNKTVTEKIEYRRRPDIEANAREEYGSLYNPEEVGFKIAIPVDKYSENDNYIEIRAMLLGKNDTVIVSQSATVGVER